MILMLVDKNNNPILTEKKQKKFLLRCSKNTTENNSNTDYDKSRVTRSTHRTRRNHSVRTIKEMCAHISQEIKERKVCQQDMKNKKKQKKTKKKIFSENRFFLQKNKFF